MFSDRPSGGDAWPTAPLVEGLPPLCLPGPFSSPSCSKARCTIGSIFVMAWLVLDTHTGTPRPLIRPTSGTEATRGPPPSPTFHHISFPDCLPCGLSSSHRCEDRASRSCSSGSQKCPRPVLPAELSAIHLSVTYLSIIYLSIYHLFIYSVQFGLLVMSDSWRSCGLQHASHQILPTAFSFLSTQSNKGKLWKPAKAVLWVFISGGSSAEMRDTDIKW